MVGVGASILHVETGLFVYAAYGAEHVDGVPAAFEDVNETWFLQGGIERKWSAIGITNILPK